MKVEYLPAKTMADMHLNGEVVRMYGYPYDDMPEDFSDREIEIFGKIEKEMIERFGSEYIYVGYDTWADLVVRIFVDINILSEELIVFLLNFMRLNCSDHYLSCVVQDLILDEWTIYGSFGFNNQRFLVDEELKEIWMEKVGTDVNWPQ